MKGCIFVFAAMLLTTTALAQNDDWELEDWSLDEMISNTRGFSVSPHLNGAAIEVEGSANVASEGGGGGIGIGIGYGVNDLITLFLNLDGTAINPERAENYGLGHGDLGIQFHFLKPDKAVRPFLGLAVTARNAEFRRGTAVATASGPGVTALGGLRYFASRSVSIDGEIDVTSGTFTEVALRIPGAEVSEPIDIKATTARIKIGISWFPGH